jgi:AcrR family transcriptional regulator
VGKTPGRREQQKALTRARIRDVAQELFSADGFDSVTIVQIAAAAQVSVQTVFNHFASKEEIFFAERSRWVDGAAAVVRARAAGERPEAALRRHLVRSVEGFARAMVLPRNRRMLEVLDATPVLQAYERSLHDESVARLAGALAELEDGSAGGRPTVLAELTAAVWMAAVRSVVLDLRFSAPRDEDDLRARVALIDRVLAELGAGLSFPGAAAARARSVA